MISGLSRIHTFDHYWLKSSIVEIMRTSAVNAGLFYGDSPVRESCKAMIETKEGFTVLIYTLDGGMHTSGWFKNPDYERCTHLSLSFRHPNGENAPFNRGLAKEWIEAFFGNGHGQEYVWAEPAYYKVGKSIEVWHFRVFCDVNWQPIKPRGEVYNTEFTEKGWRSWSEIHRNEVQTR